MFDHVKYAIYLLIALIPSLTLHEYGHAWMAERLGDHTARRAGRLTLNPIPHIDPFGTLIVPGLLLLLVAAGRGVFPVFAYAKPTPFNPQNFGNRETGTMWVALAGPGVNLILAILAAVGFRVAGGGEAAVFLGAFLLVNVILFVFNLMPIPGLDGSKIVARFLPPRAREVYRNLDQYLALFILLIFFILRAPVFDIVSGLANGLCNVLVGINCL